MKEKVLVRETGISSACGTSRKEMKTSPSTAKEHDLILRQPFPASRCCCGYPDKRVEPLPESEYSAPLPSQLAILPHRDNFRGSIAATKWVSCGL